jgi:rod shape-determining protein MreC
MARPWYGKDSLRKTALAAGVFLGVILVFWLSARIPALSAFYERLEAGIVRLGTGLGNSLTRLTTSEESLQARYAEREAQVRSLAVERASYEALEREVNELRALVGYGATTTAAAVVSHVIARSVDDQATRVLIDRGQVDGVIEGSAVVIDTGILFGLVESVREKTAVVRLVSHPESYIPAAILGQTRTIGLVEGREGVLLTMQFVPQDSELQAGDVVVTSGLDGLVREGLVIGLVTEVVSVESAPFQEAYIELLYEPREWTTVLILPPPGL